MKYLKNYWNDIEKVIKYIPNITRLNGTSILITGATGMVCSTVVEMLFYLNEQGAKITIYLAGRNIKRVKSRFSRFKEGTDYIFVEYDATKASILEINPHYIIHGASNANPSIYMKQPVETMLGNIIGLNTILRLASEKKSKRVLYISSSEVYGTIHENKTYKESDYGVVDILNPRACYPSAKRAGETLCASYSFENDFETVIVRPGHIYGPTITHSDSRASAQFTWSAIAGQDIVMKSAGTQLRSYCYTMDCASAILTVLINGENRNAYNISNKNSIVSIRDLAEAFANYTGIKIVFENPSDAEVSGYNFMSNSSLNAQKLEMLGWKAIFDLKSGVKNTVDYLRE